MVPGSPMGYNSMETFLQPWNRPKNTLVKNLGILRAINCFWKAVN